MNDQTTDRCVSLRDGRRLSYRSAGPRDGLLVLYLHGAIGSPQAVCPELEAIVHELEIHYVMVSRPGFGGSQRAPGRTLLGFADDAAALADELGRWRFAVVGVSAGGPYALACARALPARVAAATVVSCLSPAACRTPGLPVAARAALRAVRARPCAAARAGDLALATARRHPRLVAQILHAGAPPADRGLLNESAARELAATRFLAAAGSGVSGMIDDHLLCARPWGFRAEDIETCTHVWHGVQDRLVPVDDALALAASLPRARLALDPDEGHFFYRRRLREILGELAAAARAPAPAPPVRGPGVAGRA